MKKLSKKKIKERRKKGIVKAYTSRSSAIKKLQVTLSDFRRLCILKGVYPVEPKNKSKLTGGNTRRKTYFYTRDIQCLVDEPLLSKFWEFKVFMKRLSRAKGRHDLEKFQSVNENKPVYHLDSLVKERYPRFTDALRDCDDALSMCSLYAMFSKSRNRPEDLVELSAKVTLDFMDYVIQTKSLRKVFISIKGYYYQADIMGHKITWMVPHQFVIDRINDVDLNVMRTFTEFYVTFLGFVNYKLHSTIKVSENKSVTKADSGDQQLDTFEDFEEGRTTNSEKNDSDELSLQQLMALENLFKGLKIYLNREVPRESLTFIIRSFGGEVSWDKSLYPGATFDETDPTITHHVVDRADLTSRSLDRTYIQPQWIYDSVNMRMLLPVADYLIGATLPPHLSPFTNEKRGDYVQPDKTKMMKLREKFKAETNKSNSRSKMSVKEGKLKFESKEEMQLKEDAEHRKMGIMMIPKKKKRLFDKITKTQHQKSKKTKKMQDKRRIVEAVRARTGSQKTVSKDRHR